MNKVFLAAGLAVIAVVAYMLMSGQEDPNDYMASIAQHRLETERYMNSSSNSPFVASTDKIKLNYYPPNPAFKVSAQIERIEEKSYVQLGNSDGSSTRYTRYAYLHFELNGVQHKLLVLKNAEDRTAPLSLMFADETSGDTTYGGGRYLNIDFKNARRIALDFNLAYNPYCAYNDIYSCPIVPRENYLKTRIEAGVKAFGKH